MKRKALRTERLVAYVPSELKKKVESIAESEGLTVSDYLNNLIREGVKVHESSLADKA